MTALGESKTELVSSVKSVVEVQMLTPDDSTEVGMVRDVRSWTTQHALEELLHPRYVVNERWMFWGAGGSAASLWLCPGQPVCQALPSLQPEARAMAARGVAGRRFNRSYAQVSVGWIVWTDSAYLWYSSDWCRHKDFVKQIFNGLDVLWLN